MGGWVLLHFGMNRFREVAINCEKAKKAAFETATSLTSLGREGRGNGNSFPPSPRRLWAIKRLQVAAPRILKMG